MIVMTMLASPWLHVSPGLERRGNTEAPGSVRQHESAPIPAYAGSRTPS